MVSRIEFRARMNMNEEDVDLFNKLLLKERLDERNKMLKKINQFFERNNPRVEKK